ncbi:hypothetical protein AB6A40_000455 [Gnathostoma spinigerum]|uniref:Beta-lactamase-related domain-containing protein n=1 Tax=Gnathostoma spinigerum TaxID=75299 RepID=A0ABD6E3C8_9BILA
MLSDAHFIVRRSWRMPPLFTVQYRRHSLRSRKFSGRTLKKNSNPPGLHLLRTIKVNWWSIYGEDMPMWRVEGYGRKTLSHIYSQSLRLCPPYASPNLLMKERPIMMTLCQVTGPEFACNGKANTTIRHIVQHQAGLTYGPHAVTVSDVLDHRKMSKIFEEMVPLWEPGTATGYHTLTIGFLIDQLVRRIDNEARGVVDYFEQEILDKLGVEEIFIGLPNSKLNKRTTKITLPTAEDISKEGERNPEALKRYTLSNNSHQDKLYEMWPWIQLPDYNKLENRLLRMPSNMGISTARDIAHLHYLLIDGKILSKRFLNLMSKPVLVDEFDIVNGYKENKGLGWQYTRNPKGKWIFGHSGTGGQNMRVDVDSKLAYAYFCNGLKIADSDNVESFSRLQTALYSCIK